MANRVIRSPQRFSRGPKRVTDWTGIADASVNFQAVAASAKALLIVFAGNTEETIVRCRGIVTVKSDQIGSTEAQIGALSMAVVSSQAATTGASAIPGPMTSPGYAGWFVYEMFGNQMALSTAAGFDPRFGITREIDSKAMRKIGEDESVVIMYENGANGLGTDVFVNVRILTKLH